MGFLRIGGSLIERFFLGCSRFCVEMKDFWGDCCACFHVTAMENGFFFFYGES